MGLEQDLAIIARQEQRLCFDKFDEDTAWRVGSMLHDAAVKKGVAVEIDVSLCGRMVFRCAMKGTTPNNADWIRRKQNTVAHFGRCSYGMGRQLDLEKTDLVSKFGLSPSEYVAAGGCFPVRIRNVGIVGSVTVSGLPQREDHQLVVAVLAEVLGLEAKELDLD